MIAFVAPNPSVDKLFAAPALVPGAIHRPDALAAEAGGKGLNAARAAHVLGADVHAVALVGGHAGRWIADRLAAASVPADLTWCAGETRTCLSVAADGALTEFYERGDPPGGAAWDAFAARVAAVAADAGRVAICGSLPPGVAPSEAGALVAAARAAGARVAVDLAGEALAAAIAAGPDLVKVNAAEAHELTGAPDPAAAALAIRERLAAGAASDARGAARGAASDLSGAAASDAGGAARGAASVARGAVASNARGAVASDTHGVASDARGAAASDSHGVASDAHGAATGAAREPVVVVTLGEEGAVLLAGGLLVHGTLDVRGPYPVGSGDAFLAGLLADPHTTWRDAFALALGAGAANAEVAGAGRLDPDRARALAGRVVLRETQRIGSAR